MINPEYLYELFRNAGIDFFTGVPDSYLNSFCNYVLNHEADDKHIIAANEGNAIGIAAGHYFATGKVPLVYMQNSGLGNALNPLVSLADKNVYSIPMVLLVGWRGEPGTGDHPQHARQGEMTAELLDLSGIPYVFIDEEYAKSQIERIVKTAKEECCPVAIIARKGIVSSTKKENELDDDYPLSREEAIETIMDSLDNDTYFGATTGRTSRELFFLREKRQENHQNDYLNVGSMGHASSVVLGMALAKSEEQFVCLDGDGAAIMHLGALAVIGTVKPENYLHVVLNNGVHESVGGQPTAAKSIDLESVAKSLGYNTFGRGVTSKDEINAAIRDYTEKKGPYFLEIRIHKGMQHTLPPLHVDLNLSKDELMKSLKR